MRKLNGNRRGCECSRDKEKDEQWRDREHRDGGWRWRSGSASRWREDGLIAGQREGRQGKESLWRTSIGSTGSLIKKNDDNKAQYVTCTDRNMNNSNVAFVRAVGVVCVFVFAPLLAHERSKYCNRSRPSYSKMKTGVPFSTSCPPATLTPSSHHSHMRVLNIITKRRWCLLFYFSTQFSLLM